jgi:DNA-binding transcriptional MerR regulator
MDLKDDKKFYTIGEVSIKTDVKTTVLRFWESEFEELNPRKNKFGHRVYNNDDIELILKIKDLLYKQGLTIKGAKNIFRTNKPISNSREIKKQLLEILSILKKNNKNDKE